MIVWYDLETTGTDVDEARIVELAAIKTDLQGNIIDRLYFKLNPQCLIPKGASEVHGITNNDVYNCPTFEDLATELLDFFQYCVLAGYNNQNYDDPILMKEFERCGLQLEIRESIDVYLLWMKMEKTKRLGDAYKRFCNKELENWHSAEADILATMEIFGAQKEIYSIELKDVVQITRKEKKIIDGKFNFGKHKGKKLTEVDRGYLEWLILNYKDEEVKEEIKKIFYGN